MKRQKRKNWLYSIIMLSLIFFVFSFYYLKIINPVIKNYSRAKINALTEQAVNLAVSNVINTTLNYDSIVNVNYTSTGEISYVSANQYVVNSITREVVKNAQFQMLSLGEDGIKIPIGTFTGLSFFVGRGPNVKLQMLPIGIVSSNFKSEFTSVGINNTLHQLFLEITAKVELTMPFKNIKVDTTTSVLLCEGIIIGKVPEVYFNNSKLEKVLDLVP